MKKWLRNLLLIVGLGMFGYFIYQAGLEQIRAAFIGETWTDLNVNGVWDEGEPYVDATGDDRHDKGLGWWAAVVVLPYALVFSIDTLGWRLTFTHEIAAQLRYRTMWYVRLAGEAVNNVIPSMYIGGEATKVYLLHKRGVPVANTTAAAVRSKTAQSVAQSTFVAIAALVAAVALSPEMTTAKYIFGGMAVTGFVIMALLFKLQAQGMFMTMLGWVRSLGFRLKSMDAREGSLRHTDEAISTFYTHSRRRFIRCTLTYLVGWMVDTLEILLVSHALGMPVEWHQALVIEAFIGVAKGFNTVVPGAFGVQEFSVMALFLMFGHPEALGVQYAIIRRGRDLAFTALGWGFLYNDEASLKGITQRVRKEANEMKPGEDAEVN